MPIFFDDFERANGAPGGSWSNVYGTVSIVAGSLVSSGGGVAAYTGVSDNHRSEVSAHVLTPAAGQGGSGVIARMTGSGLNGYCFFIYNNWSNWTVYLRDGGYSNGNTLGSWTFPGTPNPYIELKLIWDDGDLRAYVDGVERIAITNTLYILGTYCGVFLAGSNAPVLDFSTVGGAAVSFTVTPNPVGNYGTPTPMTATGGNTSWTPGTPGSPAFTVDHGTISGQVVASAVSATFTYDPGLFLGTAIFTDPSSGAQAYVLVTSNAGVVPIGGGGLSQTAIDYIERSAIAESLGTITNRQESITVGGITRSLSETVQTITAQVTDPSIPSGGMGSLLGFVIEIFDLINGGNNWGGAATLFGNSTLTKSGVDDLATALSDMRGAGGVTLATLAAALSNLRGVGQPSLADVLSAISTPDLGPLSDKLDAMRGDTTTSLYTLLSSLAGIRTVSAYSLGDVMDAIGGIGGAPSPATAAAVVALVAALALAAPTGGASVAAAAVAVGAGPVLDIATIVELVGVLGELAAIAADVAALAARPSGGYIGAPVWPGASGATLGDAQALSDGLIVTGPLDGLIVAVTGHPAGAGKYGFGTVISWQHVGAVIFANDRGDFERAESFGLASQIITPRTMARASSAIVRLNGGWSGTVRPWIAAA